MSNYQTQPRDFTATLRSLRAERAGRRGLWGLVASVFLVTWLTWAALAQFPVSLWSESARLESRDGLVDIQAAVQARLLERRVEAGSQVLEGTPLLVLDSFLPASEFERAIASAESAQTSLEELRRRKVLADEERIARERSLQSATAKLEARLRSQEAETRALEGRLERAHSLEKAGVGSQAARIELEESVAAHRSEMEALRQESIELRRDGEANQLAAVQDLLALDGDIAEATANAATDALAVRTADRQLRETTLRSPVNGTLVDLTPLRQGSLIEAGQLLGQISPDGLIEVVGSFTEKTAGRLAEGQAVSIRLEDYPWTRFGSLQGRVRLVSWTRGDQGVEARIRIDPNSIPEGVELLPGRRARLSVVIDRQSVIELLFGKSADWIDRLVSRGGAS